MTGILGLFPPNGEFNSCIVFLRFGFCLGAEMFWLAAPPVRDSGMNSFALIQLFMRVGRYKSITYGFTLTLSELLKGQGMPAYSDGKIAGDRAL